MKQPGNTYVSSECLLKCLYMMCLDTGYVYGKFKLCLRVKCLRETSNQMCEVGAGSFGLVDSVYCSILHTIVLTQSTMCILLWVSKRGQHL